VDMVVSTLTITPDREQLIDFSRPYYLAGQSLLVRKSDRSVSGIRDLAGKRVCVISGTTGVSTLRQEAPGAVLVMAPSAGDCLAQVSSGSVAAMSTDDIVLAGLAAENDGLILTGGRFTQEPYGVGVQKDESDLVPFIDSVLDQMVQEGRWGAMYYQYLADIPGLPSVAEAKQRLLELPR